MFNIFDPGSVDPDRYIVFTFTCNSTSVTANALSVIYNESVVGHMLGVTGVVESLSSPLFCSIVPALYYYWVHVSFSFDRKHNR